ncbi:hypothetical protein R1sor_013600 [Riccia sorocarpa]|uniref:Endonuclease/exonuclease/phosphatase domain-containing protein n=1 Tax=Riccia sorocarpa TaxID=122646 RepID=A0ABD3H8X0_9MARC
MCSNANSSEGSSNPPMDPLPDAPLPTGSGSPPRQPSVAAVASPTVAPGGEGLDPDGFTPVRSRSGRNGSGRSSPTLKAVDPTINRFAALEEDVMEVVHDNVVVTPDTLRDPNELDIPVATVPAPRSLPHTMEGTWGFPKELTSLEGSGSHEPIEIPDADDLTERVGHLEMGTETVLISASPSVFPRNKLGISQHTLFKKASLKCGSLSKESARTSLQEAGVLPAPLGTARRGRAPKIVMLGEIHMSDETSRESPSDPPNFSKRGGGRMAKEEGLSQEVKVDSWRNNHWMKSVLREGSVVYDPPIGSKGGTALLLHESLSIVHKGVGGNGRLAWAQVQWGDGVIGFITVHAPNKRRLRMAFWKQMKAITREGDWFILGDFNQTELPEDAVGRSSLIQGREERWWYQFVVDKGLVDSYICAAYRTGGRFTRMVMKQSNFVGSRLDRIYFTSGAGWVHHVKEVCHHNSSRLSDHVPLTSVFQVKQQEDGLRKESYFKMSFYALLDPAVKQRAREAWGSETEIVRDSRRRWARGWQCVKNVLKDVRKESESRRRAEGSLVEEVTCRVRTEISTEISQRGRKLVEISKISSRVTQ